MKDMLYINSVNLHHRFFAGESELDVQFSFTRGQEHCYFCDDGADTCLRHNPGLTANVSSLKENSTLRYLDTVTHQMAIVMQVYEVYCPSTCLDNVDMVL